MLKDGRSALIDYTLVNVIFFALIHEYGIFLMDRNVQDLYYKILQVANNFLRNAKMFEISVLRDHNPTYEELAKIMQQVATLVHELADDFDPIMAYNAFEYASMMGKMGVAIRDENEAELRALVDELDKKPFL